MSTLTQIESAVAGLPTEEQWSLLAWLQSRLLATPRSAGGARDRDVWLAELAELRSKTHTGASGVSLQQILDDAREDRV
jgi:hypothetical protein